VNMLSGPVLVAAGLLASPAVYQAVVGGVPVETALVRGAIALVVCWAGLSVVAMLVGPPPRRTTSDEPAPTPAPAAPSS